MNTSKLTKNPKTKVFYIGSLGTVFELQIWRFFLKCIKTRGSLRRKRQSNIKDSLGHWHAPAPLT